MDCREFQRFVHVYLDGELDDRRRGYSIDARGEELVLRQGAVWLFARSPAAIEHPNLGVRVWRVNGTEQRFGAHRNVQDFPRFDGGLLVVLEQARSLISTLIRSSTRLHDLKEGHGRGTRYLRGPGWRE